MKRLIICCDGTWQTLSHPYPTNVVKIAQAVKSVASDGTPQVVYYDEGIGTGDRWERLTGGAFGWGIDEVIQNAYRFICLNYSHEDGDELYLFGFSRGAYTIRSLVGLLSCSGIVSRSDIRDTPEAYEIYREKNDERRRRKSQAFRDSHLGSVPIKLLGCWDTVGSLGIPDQVPLLPINDLLNEKYRFHNTILSSSVQHALHAVAIDERRKVFDVTPMRKNPKNEGQKIYQVWFPGEHGCIGGGTRAYRGLSDAALLWMMDMIAQLKLELELNPALVEDGIKVNHAIPFNNTPSSIVYLLTGLIDRNIVEEWIVDPTTNNIETKPLKFEDLHESVKARWRDCFNYCPPSLLPYASLLNEWATNNPLQKKK